MGPKHGSRRVSYRQRVATDIRTKQQHLPLPWSTPSCSYRPPTQASAPSIEPRLRADAWRLTAPQSQPVPCCTGACTHNCLLTRAVTHAEQQPAGNNSTTGPRTSPQQHYPMHQPLPHKQKNQLEGQRTHPALVCTGRLPSCTSQPAKQPASHVLLPQPFTGHTTSVRPCALLNHHLCHIDKCFQDACTCKLRGTHPRRVASAASRPCQFASTPRTSSSPHTG